MTNRREHYRREPRIIRTMQGLAEYLDHSVTWLSDRLARWEAMGFPPRDEELDGWDKAAVDWWIDERSGLLSPSQRGNAGLIAHDADFEVTPERPERRRRTYRA